jgi:hypothetical protein
MNRGIEAATEFQKLIDHQGIVGNHPFGALGVCREYVSTSLTLRWRYVEQHQNRERETGVTSWVAFLRPQGPFSQPMHGFSLLIP